MTMHTRHKESFKLKVTEELLEHVFLNQKRCLFSYNYNNCLLVSSLYNRFPEIFLLYDFTTSFIWVYTASNLTLNLKFLAFCELFMHFWESTFQKTTGLNVKFYGALSLIDGFVVF